MSAAWAWWHEVTGMTLGGLSEGVGALSLLAALGWFGGNWASDWVNRQVDRRDR